MLSKLLQIKFTVKIFYQNVRGLRTKADFFYVSVLQNDYDIIIITESWLNDSVFDYELFDHRYNVFRRDRSSTCSYRTKKDGGGVLIAVKKSFDVVRKTDCESQCEDLWLILKIGKMVLNICAVYIPSPLNVDYVDIFTKNTVQVIHNNMTKGISEPLFLLVGDFNMGDIEWCKDNSSAYMTPSTSGNNVYTEFLDAMSYCDLYQFNDMINANNRILDLVFSGASSDISIESAKGFSTAPDPYHPPLDIAFQETSVHVVKPDSAPALNYFKSNYEALNKDLKQVDWTNLLQESYSVDTMVDHFYQTIRPLINQHTPLRFQHNDRYPIWFSNSLIKALKHKRKFHSRYKKYGNLMDKLQFDITRKRCDVMITECYSNFKQNAPNHLKNRPKYFWKIFKDKTANSRSLPNEMKLGRVEARGGQEISELFSQHFQSVYDSNINHEKSCSSHYCNVSGNASYNIVEVNETEVLNQLKLLNADKGPGPDLIPPIFIRKCALSLYKPLAKIYTKSLQSGAYPTQWKLAHLTPIHKDGRLDDIAQYRPVSILSGFGKVLEAIVNKKLITHFKQSIDTNQHGFLPSKSTNTNLVSYVSDIIDTMDGGGEVHSIYTDFRKAFDLVNHNCLLHKLAELGIHGSLLRWCESYIRNRSQLVNIQGFKSRVHMVPSGVPQGSHLGPFFFLVYINNIKHVIQSKFKLYADDLKVYRAVEDHSDIMALQSDINAIYKWSTQNYMHLNLQKCNFIKFTRKRVPFQATYFINNTPLQEVNTVRDLGIILDSALSFRPILIT